MKPGRNDPCPCGSGKKYKRCCGLKPAAVSAPQILSAHEIGALVAMIHEGRLSDAEDQARTLLEIHPDAGMLWKILSVALLRQGKDALPALRRAAELMPQDAETITFGAASSIRTASSLAAKPPNTTECTAPILAQASMATAASGTIGR